MRFPLLVSSLVVFAAFCMLFGAACAGDMPVVNKRGQVIGHVGTSNGRFIVRDRSGRLQSTYTPVRGRLIIQDRRGIRK